MAGVARLAAKYPAELPVTAGPELVYDVRQLAGDLHVRFDADVLGFHTSYRPAAGVDSPAQWLTIDTAGGRVAVALPSESYDPTGRRLDLVLAALDAGLRDQLAGVFHAVIVDHAGTWMVAHLSYDDQDGVSW